VCAAKRAVAKAEERTKWTEKKVVAGPNAIYKELGRGCRQSQGHSSTSNLQQASYDYTTGEAPEMAEARREKRVRVGGEAGFTQKVNRLTLTHLRGRVYVVATKGSKERAQGRLGSDNRQDLLGGRKHRKGGG